MLFLSCLSCLKAEKIGSQLKLSVLLIADRVPNSAYLVHQWELILAAPTSNYNE